MKTILFASALALLATFGSPAAEARHDKANDRARSLISRMKTHRPKRPSVASVPLLNFSSSPRVPTQYQNLTWIVQFDNPFTNRLLSIEAKNNGVAVTGITSPFKGMFVVPLGLQSLAQSGSLEVTLYAEDANNNTDVRAAITALDTDIRRLTTQINAERDPAKRAILQEQRSEKLALKEELVTQLKKYRWKLGVQAQSYTIAADTNAPNAPRIVAVSPIGGSVHGGSVLTVSGFNFGRFPGRDSRASVSAILGGLPATSATLVNENTVQLVVPDFGSSVGPKDLELRFTDGSRTSNATLGNAFFASDVVFGGSEKPVAIATGGQQIHLGDAATFDGTQSFAPRTSAIDYQWTVVSSPVGSSFVAGRVLGSNTTLTFVPDVTGSYVMQLVVSEHDTSEHLSSDPSIVAVYAGTGPRAQASAISVFANSSATTQVVVEGASGSVFYAVSTAPQHGTASVSDSGLVTYAPSTNYSGSDSLSITVTDQSGQTGVVAIPVSILGLQPEVDAPVLFSHTEPTSGLLLVNNGAPASDYTFTVSTNPSNGTASVDASGVVHYASNSGFTGQDVFWVRVTDPRSQKSARAPVLVSVNANSTPSLAASGMQVVTGGTVATQATLTDDAGQVGSYSVATPAHGTASVNSTGLVTFVAAAYYAGSDTVVLSYTDNGNPALTGNVSIPVTIIGPPTASAPTITLATGDYATSQITASPSIPGRALTFTVTSSPVNGMATVSSSGLVTYTSNAPFTGSDSLTVTVADELAPTAYTMVTIPVTVTANHAPSVSAPGITVAARDTATTQASVTDEDPNQTFTYAIVQQPVRGTASVNASGLVSYTSSVGYANSDSIGLRVTDSGTPNQSTVISIPVTVTGPSDQPPVIPSPLFFRILSRGVPYQVGLSLSSAATPSGGVTDPDGTVASLVWDFGDGTHERITDLTQASVLHNYMAPGTYTATLTATDNLGLATTQTLTVNVVDTDIPVAKFFVNPANGGNGTLPVTITFDASASSDSNGITQYRWLFCNQGSEVVTTSPTIQRTFTSAGTCQVRLRVRDSNVAEGSATVPVVVGSASTGVPVQAAFQVGPPREVVLGSAMTFDGSRSFNPSSSTATIGTWNWNFNDTFACPNPNGGCTASGVSASYTYNSFAINYFPSLQVVNPAGTNTSSRVNQEVFAVNAGHAPHAILRSSATSGVAPLTVNFDGNDSYDYDGTISFCQIRWDSTAALETGCTNSHTYSTPGVYIASLVANDNDGNRHLVSQTITVTATRSELKKARTTDSDPEREYQRQILTGAGGQGDAEACHNLAGMFREDGDEFTASKLDEMSCNMGFLAACQN